MDNGGSFENRCFFCGVAFCAAATQEMCFQKELNLIRESIVSKCSASGFFAGGNLFIGVPFCPVVLGNSF